MNSRYINVRDIGAITELIKKFVEDERGSMSIPGIRLSGKRNARLPIAQQLIDQKHRDYLKKSRLYHLLYFTTRISAALSSGLLPFVVGNNPTIATYLSIIIVVAIVLDSVFDPKGNWQLYSRATDLLAIAELKTRGDYDKYKEQLEILIATEAKTLERLVDLEDILKKIREEKP